ncbi:DNA methyltransferase [Candidatus Leptofilum sp.]|uniref:DNA methyltransferase n=1 Tax=Candidatus Leptofilum sp. TaxID=3241576 RepID=UPI003B5974CF
MKIPLDTDFDTDFANQIAQLEAYNKHHYRPNSYLHKWWARRCGSTFRLILKQLVDDEAQRNYYAPGGLAGKIILDPMMGGGTTLHEAIRLGAHVIGADLEPIPVLQARATLTPVDMAAMEQAYQDFYTALRQAVAPFFQTKCADCGVETAVNYTLYGVQRKCNGRPVIMVDSLVLRIESDGSTIQLCPRCHAVLVDTAVCHCHTNDKPPLLEKGSKTFAGEPATFEDDLSLPFYQRYKPLVLVTRCPRQKKLKFKVPDADDLARLAQADELRQSLPFDHADFAIEPGRKSRQLTLRGIHNYLDLFSSRQLLYLHHAVQLPPQFPAEIRLNLGLLVSTSLEFNSMLCGYKGKNKRRAGAIRHTFSHHAYSLPYTALENNPVYPRKASGTLQKLFQSRIRNGRSWAQQPRERVIREQLSVNNKQNFVAIVGEQDCGVEVDSVREMTPESSQRFLLLQGSSTQLDLPDGSVDFIVTDPPYFDSVQYSDLAAFFRVWLRHLLPDAANWAYDTQQSAVDPHQLDSESRYTELMTGIFTECRRVLKEDGNGRFIFTFHHWNPKGWAALTVALRQAGFALVNRYVVHSESPISVHISGMRALLHDAILVFAPAERVDVVWERPSQINLADSEQFCYDCGTFLGWILQQDVGETAVLPLWQAALADS